MAAEALLFDVDCTLWDSPAWYSKALGNMVGIHADGVCRQLIEGASIVSIIKELGVSRSGFVRGCLAMPGAPFFYPEVKETLEELLARRMPMGVVTRLPGTIVTPLIKGAGIDECFGIVVHAGNCHTRKPNPGGIRMALAELGVPASGKVCYVGDSSVDAATARNAGVSFAWVSYAYEKQPEGCRYVLKNFRELVRL